MKINNEAKVGALTIIAITILILGYNFMKGKSLFSKTLDVYAYYENINGLETGSKVIYKGLQIGQVEEIELEQGKIKTTFALQTDMDIPKNSEMKIVSTDIMGSMAVELILGKSSESIEDGDVLKGTFAKSLTESLKTEVEPIKANLEDILVDSDSLINHLNETMEGGTKKDVKDAITNIKVLTASLIGLSAKLNQTVESTNILIKNVAKHDQQIGKLLENTNKSVAKLPETIDEMKKTVKSTNASVLELKKTLEKLNSKEGSIGKLMNDDQLYDNMTLSASSLDSLLTDLKNHPGRYVHFSLFGRKDKSDKNNKKSKD